MHAKQKGNLGEMAVAKHLIAEGYAVFYELGDLSKIDLIAVKNDEMTKIQVKSRKLRKDNSVELKAEKAGPNYRYRYTKDDVDIFALYAIDTDQIAFINAEWFLKNFKNAISIRVHIAKNNQIRKIHDINEFLNFEEALRGHTLPA